MLQYNYENLFDIYTRDESDEDSYLDNVPRETELDCISLEEAKSKFQDDLFHAVSGDMFAIVCFVLCIVGGFVVTFLGHILGIIMMTGEILLSGKYNGSLFPDMNEWKVMFAYILGFSLLCGMLSVLVIISNVIKYAAKYA